MNINERIFRILIGISLSVLVQATAHAGVIAQGTAIADWTSFSITGPLSVLQTDPYTYTSLDSSLVNELGADFDTASSQDWSSPIGISSIVDNDSSSASADQNEVRASDTVSTATATAASPFNVAGSVSNAGRFGKYLVTADGTVTLEIDYILTAKGVTQFIGEEAWLNVIIAMELYIDGIGPAPVAYDSASISTLLVDGATGDFQQSGTLSLSYYLLTGTTGFFHVTTTANDIAQATYIPEPVTLVLITIGLAGMGFRQKRLR